MKPVVDFLFEKVVASLVRVLCATLLAVILIQIFSRIFLPRAFSWTEELSRLTFIWFCMLAGTLTLRMNLHIGIDYLYLKAKRLHKKVLDLVIYGLIALFGAILVVYGIRLLALVGDETTSVLRWPSAVYYASIPVSGLLYALYSTMRIIELIQTKEA